MGSLLKGSTGPTHSKKTLFKKIVAYILKNQCVLITVNLYVMAVWVLGHYVSGMSILCFHLSHCTVLHTYSTTYIQYHIHTVLHTYSTTYIQYHIHTVPHTYSTTYIQYHIHTVPHTYSTTYIQYYIQCNGQQTPCIFNKLSCMCGNVHFL